MSFRLASTSFDGDGIIPIRFTPEGKDLSPALHWTGLPEGTKELALIVEDPDAGAGSSLVYWMLYKIPSTIANVPEGLPMSAVLEHPSGALQGKNSLGSLGYRGPNLSEGSSTRRARFRLVALDVPLIVHSGLSSEALLQAMEGHILGSAELMGTYERAADLSQDKIENR